MNGYIQILAQKSYLNQWKNLDFSRAGALPERWFFYSLNLTIYQ
jgi:hypothetical protein